MLMQKVDYSDAARDVFQKVAEAYVREQCQHQKQWAFRYGREDSAAIDELVAGGLLDLRELPGHVSGGGLTPLGERAILLGLIPVPNQEQRMVIDLVADHVLACREPLSKLFLVKGVEEHARRTGQAIDANSLLGSIEDSYLNAIEKYPKYRYDLTTIGWLASKCRPRIEAVAGGMLQLFRQRLAERSLHPYTWEELKGRQLASDDSDQYFVDKVLTMLGMSMGQTDTGWNLPADRELESLLSYDDPVVFLTDKWLAWIRSRIGVQSLMFQDPRGSFYRGYDPSRELAEALEALGHEVKMDQIGVFVSHSAKDHVLARAFVDCLEACVEAPDKAIRCTSVPGHKLAPGDVSDEVLRENLERCSVVVGLLTDESLSSGYVVMELGAAWGLKKTTCALLASNVAFDRLPGPMSRLHAIKADSDHDIASLMEVIAEKTGFPMRNRAKFTAAVSAFVVVAKANP
jgi:hypothetical protein